MPLYSIMIDEAKCPAFESSLLEMYPNQPLVSHKLIYARIYEVELTTQEYTAITIKHKLPPHRTKIIRRYL